jgi:hypothetical protein
MKLLKSTETLWLFPKTFFGYYQFRKKSLKIHLLNQLDKTVTHQPQPRRQIKFSSNWGIKSSIFIISLRGLSNRSRWCGLLNIEINLLFIAVKHAYYSSFILSIKMARVLQLMLGERRILKL